jgi:LPS-assembly protein
MSSRRLALLAGLVMPLCLTASLAVAVGAGDVGGWGQAWGEDAQPDAQPVRPRASVPVAAPVAAPVAPAGPVSQPVTRAPAMDSGSWGQAWGDDGPPVAAPVRPRASVPVAVPVAPAAPAAQPLSRAPVMDSGGWGQAWGEEITPAPVRPRAVPAVTPALPAGPVASPAPATPRTGAGDIRGWGDAWEDGDTVAAPVRTVRPTGPGLVPSSSPSPKPASAMPETAAPGKAVAENEDADEPVHLTADQIIHDRELGIVTAKGRVEVSQNGRTLITDTLSYNLKQDVMSAAGNVTLMEPQGDTIFAEYFELTGDMKDGVGKELRMLLSDRSRLAAASGSRVGGNRTDFDKAVYTACEPCRNKPDQRPLWEAKAARITHDQAEQVIEYRDAWIELAGIPVAYTPYLSHPDPTVKRKTGFLTATPGLSSNLGANITTPYFWAIADNQDITFSPRFLFPVSTVTKTPDTLESAQDSALQRVVMAGEHRWRGRTGEARTAASFTQDRRTALNRGHIDAEGRFDLDDSWRAGYQVQRASDGTYNSLYGYPINSSRPWLTTRPYLEGFGRRNYAMVEAMSFQGLRSQDEDEVSPLVLPHATFSHLSHPDSKGGYWSFDSDALAYSRQEGVSSRRVSSQMAWNRPFRGKRGDLTDLSVSMRGDGYHSDHLGESQGSASAGRVIPQVAANWRFPFIRPSATLPQIIEPRLMFAASPNGGNPRKIPNEDSLDTELDEISIMRANRLPGIDRVEGGIRGAYGLRWSAHPRRLGYVSAQLAQGWRAHPDSTYGKDSGFQDVLSDYVGRIDYAPTGNIAFLNRIRLDKDTGEIRRNENSLSVGSPLLRAAVSYLRFDSYGVGDVSLPGRQALAYSLTSQMTRYWALMGSASHDLSDGAGPLGWMARLTYSDECFAFVTNMRRFYTHDRDMLAGYELTLNIVFKTLGDVPFNVF